MELNGKLLAGLSALVAVAASLYYMTGAQQAPERQPVGTPAVESPAPAAQAEPEAPLAETSVGEASGSLSFWKYARPEDLLRDNGPGGEPVLKIDLTPLSAIAVWNPEKQTLRVKRRQCRATSDGSLVTQFTRPAGDANDPSSVGVGVSRLRPMLVGRRRWSLLSPPLLTVPRSGQQTSGGK